eukprot:TRINITY_DN1905_c0_g1_i5.p1 TRINITY_DN1905_c0_g1~~TRINITY_DN1905_c0_g1_i5.p1  ORF type:complete len:620 (-),score=154.20 TRINITY_DN1905_c0_g1_i5:344-2203(-)
MSEHLQDVEALQKYIKQQEKDWRRTKLILEQKNELLELQIQEAKDREDSLRKMNASIMQALNEMSRDSNPLNSKAARELELLTEAHSRDIQELKFKMGEHVKTLERELKDYKDKYNEMELNYKQLAMSHEKSELINHQKISSLEREKNNLSIMLSVYESCKDDPIIAKQKRLEAQLAESQKALTMEKERNETLAQDLRKKNGDQNVMSVECQTEAFQDERDFQIETLLRKIDLICEERDESLRNNSLLMKALDQMEIALQRAQDKEARVEEIIEQNQHLTNQLELLSKENLKYQLNLEGITNQVQRFNRRDIREERSMSFKDQKSKQLPKKGKENEMAEVRRMNAECVKKTKKGKTKYANIDLETKTTDNRNDSLLLSLFKSTDGRLNSSRTKQPPQVQPQRSNRGQSEFSRLLQKESSALEDNSKLKLSFFPNAKDFQRESSMMSLLGDNQSEGGTGNCRESLALPRSSTIMNNNYILSDKSLLSHKTQNSLHNILEVLCSTICNSNSQGHNQSSDLVPSERNSMSVEGSDDMVLQNRKLEDKLRSIEVKLKESQQINEQLIKDEIRNLICVLAKGGAYQIAGTEQLVSNLSANKENYNIEFSSPPSEVSSHSLCGIS